MNYPKEYNELMDSFYEIERILDALEKKPHTYGAEHLIYSGEAHTLKIIAENEGITQKGLSERMYRTKGATSIMVDKLVKKGLITKSSGRGDQRKNTLYLTDIGKTVNENHLKYDENWISSWFSNMNIPQEDLKITNQVIKKCIEYYRKYFQENLNDKKSELK